ncbi:CPBP family intramembrane glutamic endopeptidase [Candidatus Karelsulcia muelleri]|uniref:CAAX amino terminal protease family protein n=1 Tax=Candidatus Karelsulcia muelleri PSPU TaxID=1189303 RepID=A0AAD1EXF4_9FLAO|nr:CPBP family intramembrane glutamic endopeptidase [Candidatus Karelsulcia muelleri]NJJ98670.1 CPBP family intramembrane metalloprotease [Candidatus Karelsulcia muelleri]BAO66326.1 CAAX amino terminal protease family protein [Candidatus Karelsulcia muelleri PSPU]
MTKIIYVLNSKFSYKYSIEIILKFIIFKILTLILKNYFYILNINKYTLFYTLYIFPYILIYIYIKNNKNNKKIIFLKKKNKKINYYFFFIFIIFIILFNNYFCGLNKFFVSKQSLKDIKNLDIKTYKYPYIFIPTITLLAPFFEEILFRGIILNILYNNEDPIKAILFSSLLFGFIHMNILQFISGFFIGNIIGVSYVTTFSINICILIHIYNNMIAIISSNKFLSLYDKSKILILILSITIVIDKKLNNKIRWAYL